MHCPLEVKELDSSFSELYNYYVEAASQHTQRILTTIRSQLKRSVQSFLDPPWPYWKRPIENAPLTLAQKKLTLLFFFTPSTSLRFVSFHCNRLERHLPCPETGRPLQVLPPNLICKTRRRTYIYFSSILSLIDLPKCGRKKNKYLNVIGATTIWGIKAYQNLRNDAKRALAQNSSLHLFYRLHWLSFLSLGNLGFLKATWVLWSILLVRACFWRISVWILCHKSFAVRTFLYPLDRGYCETYLFICHLWTRRCVHLGFVGVGW